MPVYTTEISQNPGQAYADLPQVTRDYLARGESPGNRDNALFAAACQFRDAGYSQQEASAALTPRAEADGFSEAYAVKKIESAYSREARTPSRSRSNDHHSATHSSSAHGTQETEQLVRLDPKGSKARPLPNPIAEGYRVMLETCFLPGEGVSIGDGTRNSEGELILSAGQVLPLEHWLKRLRSKSIMDIYQAREGIFVRINPMQLPRGKTDAEVTAFRHLLVDFDRDANGQLVPKETQYGWLVDSNLPIDSIVDSANRGLNALVRLDAPSREEFERRRDLVFKYFADCPGFDTKNKNASRYSRLPGAIRNLYDDSGQLIGTAVQQLLAVKIGAKSWEEWEAGLDYTDAELAELTRQRMEYYRSKDRPLPVPMDKAAFHGIAGQIVDIIAAVSEPSRESLLAQLLVGLGNIMGRAVYYKQSVTHHLNEFVVLVGGTSIGRKGTALVAIKNLLKELDLHWLSNRVRDGFQSGEAIVHEIRDPSSTRTRSGRVVPDPGESDKRLQIIEEEFARVLVIGNRQQNTLSLTLRKAWDSPEWLHTSGKNSSEIATGPHISLIGHITPEELRKCLDEVENRNGFSNRILWLAVERTKVVPRPPWIRWKDYTDILNRLRAIIGTFQTERQLDFSQEAKLEWDGYYSRGRSSQSGILGPIIARSPGHVLRLCMLYAVLDHSALMELPHLRAALAFVDYCERSAQWAFNEKTGNKVADRIWWALQRHAQGMTRTQISVEVCSRNCPKVILDAALAELVDAGLAYMSLEPSPKDKNLVERWLAK
jgi:hypothetical protein